MSGRPNFLPLIIDLYQRAETAIERFPDLMWRKRPAKQPLGVFRAHVDTSVTHRHAKVLVPVGAMEGMTVFGEETGPGNAG